MIKGNDLRIGNFVFYPSVDLDNGNQIKEITKVDGNDIKCQDIRAIFEPIPLTEEWLLRVGFVLGFDVFTEFYHNKKVKIYLNEFDGLTDKGTWLCLLFGNNIGVNIKYVHQLQNLYFALTGEELTV